MVQLIKLSKYGKSERVSEVDFIQPEHNCTPRNGKGHPYKPGSLLVEGARLMHTGVKVNIIDGNIDRNILKSLRSRFVGINLLGAPYIPEVIKLQAKIDDETNNETIYLLGGQVISGLTPEQFTRLFGDRAFNGNDDETLARVLGLRVGSLIPPEETSLTNIYATIPDDIMRQYLSTEFSLYVSQGCQYSCAPCAAVRTFLNPITGERTKVAERYRKAEIIEKDLKYLVKKAREFGLNELKIYMSNLDVFQTPTELLKFIGAVENVKNEYPGFGIRLRGLSTAKHYLEATKSYPDLIEKLTEIGFDTVGFGVDGITAQTWRAIHKGFNTKEDCENAIKSARENGITPEVLMVFGHYGIDTEETVKLEYEFTVEMLSKYGAIPRPHVAKNFVPGNDGWIHPKNALAVETLMRHPHAFHGIDFTARASKLTHPDGPFRDTTNYTYSDICSIPECGTKPLIPIEPDSTPEQRDRINKENEGKWDH